MMEVGERGVNLANNRSTISAGAIAGVGEIIQVEKDELTPETFDTGVVRNAKFSGIGVTILQEGYIELLGRAFDVPMKLIRDLLVY